ncbi:FtsW/RodA/SpoVE family cell cycle protein, partial [Spongiibacter sp.]|uniref:FtsW/RodA/SpoVE family cell cycle protein n=1 Tax=Spongiibacter sp. TaxID=2024860 RepID=UPI0035699326
RMKRLTAFTDPWADQFNTGYQLTQSLIAFGRGELTGVGLGNSVQKLFYLPEAHTDFVFAIFAEEFGFLGTLVILGLFVGLVGRILYIGRYAESTGRQFHAFVAYGVAMMISAQAFINMGVNTGLLPTKGLTLPFLSYGGSSLMVCMAMVALVARIERECRGEHGQ